MSIFGIKKFHKFIHSRWFVLQTDHCPLISILASKKGILAHTANRFATLGYYFAKLWFSDGICTFKKVGPCWHSFKADTEIEDMVIMALKSKSEIKGVLIYTVHKL